MHVAATVSSYKPLRKYVLINTLPDTGVVVLCFVERCLGIDDKRRQNRAVWILKTRSATETTGIDDSLQCMIRQFIRTRKHAILIQAHVASVAIHVMRWLVAVQLSMAAVHDLRGRH